MLGLADDAKLYLLYLAEEAREKEGEEWGDERIVEAQTLLEKEVESLMGREIHAEWCDAAEGCRMDEGEIIDWIVKKVKECPIVDWCDHELEL